MVVPTVTVMLPFSPQVEPHLSLLRHEFSYHPVESKIENLGQIRVTML